MQTNFKLRDTEVPRVTPAKVDDNESISKSTNKHHKPNQHWARKSQQYPHLENINVSYVETVSAFAELKKEWNLLLQSAHESTPFLSWEWQFTWWETFAQCKDQLKIILIHNEDKLIGIAPFYVKKNGLRKILKCIGEGEGKHEAIVTHYQDIICIDQYNDFVSTLVADKLNKHKSWDYSEFSFILDDSKLFRLMEKLNTPRKLTYSLGNRYILDLKRSFEELYNSLGKSSRKSFRSKKNRLKKEGELSISSLDINNNIEASLDLHEAFHTHRQKTLGNSALYQVPRFRQFHHNLMERLKGTDKAQIRMFNVGDNTIASALNYLSKDVKNPTIYAYSAGYKSSDDARLSPMFIFDMLEFEHLIENNVAYYDFLSSTEEASYKNAYRCEVQAVSKIRWFESTPVGLCFYYGFKARRRLSPLKKKVKQWMKK